MYEIVNETDFTAISDWTMLVPLSFLQMAFFMIMITVPEKIKKKIDERYAIAPFNSIAKFLRDNPDVDEFLQKMVDSEPWFESKRRGSSAYIPRVNSKEKTLEVLEKLRYSLICV